MTEREIAAYTGLSVDRLTDFRVKRLMPVVDWCRDNQKNGAPVYYTEEGLRKLQTELGGITIAPPTPQSSPAGQQEGSHPEKSAALVADFVVERLCPNPLWVECRLDEKLVPVKVANNGRLHRGKKLPGCRMMKDGAREYWAYPGRCW